MADADPALAAVVAALHATLGRELADPEQRFVVGYSGGIDSTVLLGALVREVARERVRALHIDHGLAPDSVRWARHCESVGRALDVAVESIRVAVEPRGSYESGARLARYRAFEARIGVDDVLLLAHNANDQAETLLLRLAQGRRAAGMPARRAIGLGVLVRPLLDVTRETIASAARAVGLDWIEDASNADVAHDRNYLRHVVLPKLSARFPEVVTRLARGADALARLQALADRALDVEAGDSRGGRLPIAQLRASDQRASLVRHWLVRCGVHGVTQRAIGELFRQLDLAELSPQSGRAAVHVSPRHEIRALAGDLHVAAAGPRAFAPVLWRLGAAPEASLDLPAARLLAGWTGSCAPPAACVEVRPRAGGERLLVGHGDATKSVKVKALLHAARVAPWQRASYPLVFCDGRLAVVPGVAVAKDVAERFSTSPAPRDGGRWLFSLAS